MMIEEQTDVSPVIVALIEAFADIQCHTVDLKKALQDRLPDMSGTLLDGRDIMRSLTACDYMIRISIPVILREYGCKMDAQVLESLPRIVDDATLNTAFKVGYYVKVMNLMHCQNVCTHDQVVQEKMAEHGMAIPCSANCKYFKVSQILLCALPVFGHIARKNPQEAMECLAGSITMSIDQMLACLGRMIAATA